MLLFYSIHNLGKDTHAYYVFRKRYSTTQTSTWAHGQYPCHVLYESAQLRIHIHTLVQIQYVLYLVSILGSRRKIIINYYQLLFNHSRPSRPVHRWAEDTVSPAFRLRVVTARLVISHSFVKQRLVVVCFCALALRDYQLQSLCILTQLLTN